MLRILPNILMIASTIFTLFLTDQVEAYCAKCIKIEEDRAKEQAANPQPFHYYDDLIGLHSENSVSKKEVSEKGSETSKKSSFRSTTEKEQSFDSEKNSYSPSRTEKNTKRGLFALNTRNGDSPFFEESEVHGHFDTVSPSLRNNQTKNTLPSTQHPQNLSSFYSTIYTIFKTRNFLETLSDSFTLFIPTNEAIRKLPPNLLINLAAPENSEKLAFLVGNHVVARRLLRKDFEEYNNSEIKAINGRNLTLSSKNGFLFIDGVQILRAEPAGDNGIIYIINRVLYH